MSVLGSADEASAVILAVAGVVEDPFLIGARLVVEGMEPASGIPRKVCLSLGSQETRGRLA